MGSGHPDLNALLSVFQTDRLTSPGCLTSSRRGSPGLCEPDLNTLLSVLKAGQRVFKTLRSVFKIGSERSRMHLCSNPGVTRPTSDMVPSGRPCLCIPPEKEYSQKVSEKSAL